MDDQAEALVQDLVTKIIADRPDLQRARKRHRAKLKRGQSSHPESDAFLANFRKALADAQS